MRANRIQSLESRRDDTLARPHCSRPRCRAFVLPSLKIFDLRVFNLESSNLKSKICNLKSEIPLLCILQLACEQGHGSGVVEVGEIGVAGQGFAFFTVDQDLHSQNVGNVGNERLDERGNGEFFLEHSGAVAVGESRVQIDDGDPGRDQVNGADFGARGKRMWGTFRQIDGQQRTQKFLRALLSRGWERNFGSLRAQDAGIIEGDVQRDSLGRAGDWRRDWGLRDAGARGVGGAA